jgi:hypothetical protein
MSIKDLIHQAKSLVIEDDSPVAAVKPTGTVVPHPAFNLPPMSTGGGAAVAPALSGGSPFAVPSTTVLDEKTYQMVLAKTNFNTTTVGKAILKYYDALEGVIADQSARFKAAIQQAQKLDGITPDQVLATFDQLSTALDSDAQAFQNLCASFESKEITARQTQITNLQKQVESINAQIGTLNSDLADKTVSHSNAVQQYGLAQSRRAQEIAAQKAQVASLLR